MTEVGGTELILLLIIGLIVLGPRRLPEIANRVGGWIGQARRMTRVMKRQLEDELRLDDDFKIKPPAPTPAARPPAVPEPQPAETQEEPAPKEHVPHDDDTYSPLHDDAAPDTDGSTAKEESK